VLTGLSSDQGVAKPAWPAKFWPANRRAHSSNSRAARLSLVNSRSHAASRRAAAWTSGQVDAVMATYVHDEPLLVFLGDTPLKGPDSVRAALDARAAAPGGLGTLSYEWFETMQFDVNTAVVSGRAVMTRDGKTHRGLFTRILRRTVDGWLIVHDQLAWGPEA